MFLPIVDSNGQYRLLNAQDILYLQTDSKGKLYFYTFDESYRAVSLLREWAELLLPEGFIQTDRGTIVNAKKIESYDPKLRVVTIPVKHGAIFIPMEACSFDKPRGQSLSTRIYRRIVDLPIHTNKRMTATIPNIMTINKLGFISMIQ